MSNFYQNYKVAKKSLDEVLDIIKNESNNLQDRYNLFCQSIELLPTTIGFSNSKLTDAQSDIKDISLIDRTYIDIENYLTTLIEELYIYLPDDCYEVYGDNVPLPIMLVYSESKHKTIIQKRIECILNECNRYILRF